MVCPSPNFVTNGAAYLNSSTVVTESGNCCFTLFTALSAHGKHIGMDFAESIDQGVDIELRLLL